MHRQMHHFPSLPALHRRIRRHPPISDLLAKWLGIFMFGGRGIQRIRDPVALTLAEMVDQQVAGNGGDPGHKRTLARIICIESPVHLDKDLLGEVLRIVGVTSKPVADVVYPPVIALNDLLPSRGIARNTATDQQSDNLGFFQTRLP